MEKNELMFQDRFRRKKDNVIPQKATQSEIYQKQDRKYNLWLGKKLTLRKKAATMSSSRYLARHNRALMILAVY